jgi:hypothetical protein
MKERGCTKLVTLEDITCLTLTRISIDTKSILPTTNATYVTIAFWDQKNGELWQKRTHQRSPDTTLCPICHMAYLTYHILWTSPRGTKEEINIFQPPKLRNRAPKPLFFTAEYTTTVLRTSCVLSPMPFSYSSAKISGRSTRAGAAMALYLEGCSTAEIKMMGQWQSDAMLVYLGPMATNTFKHLSNKMTTNHHVRSMIDAPHHPRPINMDETDNIRPELEHSFDGSKPIRQPYAPTLPGHCSTSRHLGQWTWPSSDPRGGVGADVLVCPTLLLSLDPVSPFSLSIHLEC